MRGTRSLPPLQRSAWRQTRSRYVRRSFSSAFLRGGVYPKKLGELKQGIFQDREVQIAVDGRPALGGSDETGFAEYREMRRHRRLCDLEVTCQLAGGQWSAAEQRKDPTPRRVS